MASGGQVWLVDASIAFILVLVLVQFCLLWTHTVTGSAVAMHATAEKQKRLIAASDRLINDPKCLAKVDESVWRVVPQTIDTARIGKEAEYCHGNYSISGRGELGGGGLDGSKSGGGIDLMPPPSIGLRDGIVVKRLVFLDDEGGEAGVLAVW